MGQDGIKTFRDLQAEVISVGLCGKCGGCVSFCSAGTLHALEMGEDDIPRFADEERCLACGICYMICPSTTELDAEVQNRSGWRPPIGIYETIRSARVADPAIREVATDGGVVTALLLYMLESHMIDGAIVSRKTSILSREPMIATTRQELIAAAGSHFGGSSHLEELGDRYTTYSPTLSAVRGLKNESLQRVAMVGTPCQIRTVKKMQCLGILPAHIITFAIGLFCIENLQFDEPGRRVLEDKLHVDFEEIDKLNIKDDMIISLNDGSTVHVPLDELEEMARPACLACTDFANDYADISAGGLGSPNGYTTILIRTRGGNQVYNEAVSHGYVEERADRRSGVEGWAEARSEQARMVDLVISFARQKRMRGEARRMSASARHGR